MQPKKNQGLLADSPLPLPDNIDLLSQGLTYQTASLALLACLLKVNKAGSLFKSMGLCHKCLAPDCSAFLARKKKKKHSGRCRIAS